jgi:hypothetical protein
LAEFTVLAGIDPSTDLETAVRELPDVLNTNFGPVGSPGRKELSEAIKRGLKRGRDRRHVGPRSHPYCTVPERYFLLIFNICSSSNVSQAWKTIS